MYLYIFGSACRGELDKFSDIDLIAIHTPEESIDHLDSDKLSIYRENKIKKLWLDGNPFAWHLHLESKLVFSSDGKDFLKDLSQPNSYNEGLNDCKKFYDILEKSANSAKQDRYSIVFDFSTIFLCIRNISTCYSLHFNKPNFSRDSAILLPQHKLNIDSEVYNILKNCRLANTRGLEFFLQDFEVQLVINNLDEIRVWAKNLIEIVKNDSF